MTKLFVFSFSLASVYFFEISTFLHAHFLPYLKTARPLDLTKESADLTYLKVLLSKKKDSFLATTNKNP
jgi:hypothetical protein